ncbi:hypothetical protein [Schlesneria sp. T3-172]|uniref:hypothetical protein n=1 Tax=Schlesneria sphaerica TaxID=3373610 RepID=UPI0037C6C98C
MLLNRSLYCRLIDHGLNVVSKTEPQDYPFPHVLFDGIFPDDIYRRLLKSYPSAEHFVKANQKHHSNEYGGSTRQRMSLCESALNSLNEQDHMLWSTVRAAISSTEFRDAVFQKLSTGLCRRFKVRAAELPTIPAYPRGQLYSETEGYRITPHPDTREKIVTMQFAFPSDDSLASVGTEFYTRSLNPAHYLREPRGFTISKTMPFLPNHAYAFSVLNDLGLKSWHGRSTIPPMDRVRNTLLHIWYAEPDESDKDLVAYRKFLETPVPVRKSA